MSVNPKTFLVNIFYAPAHKQRQFLTFSLDLHFILSSTAAEKLQQKYKNDRLTTHQIVEGE